MSQSVQLVWDKCLSIIQTQPEVTPQSFKTWFMPIKPVRLVDCVLTIQVPSQFFYEWLEEHFVSALRKAVKSELGSEGRLEYAIVMDSSSPKNKPFTINIPTGSVGKPSESGSSNFFKTKGEGDDIKNPFVIPGIKRINVDSQLNPIYSFDTFIEGECNRLGRSAGWSVAKNSGRTAFNPLFIYGGVGLGKTHLAQAIGNEIKNEHENKNVLYVSSERFTNQFIESIRNNSINDFTNFYQVIDVLIIDDIQFFTGKEKTQDILFTIFNTLHQSNKQLILTSDKAPRDLQGMEERLLSRFKWGLSADLQVPDFETRAAILRQKMYSNGIKMSSEVVDYIAHNISSNIRELEGALISMLAHSSYNQQSPDLIFAKNILNKLTKNVSEVSLSIQSIQEMVAEYFEITVDDLLSRTRKREIAQARQVAIYFVKKCTNMSLKSIGDSFGGRDHTTMMHSYKTVKDLIQTDKRFRDFIEDIKIKLKLE